jgi:NAD(P)-dependent dehydrogenase (short-subunit alcohol dehydrogenase family)
MAPPQRPTSTNIHHEVDNEENHTTNPRSVIVTGALTGIGRAAAHAFALRGDHLVIAGRHSAAGAEVAAELRALGAEVEFVQTDVRFEGEVEALVEATIARFGRVDVTVNAAGTEGHSAAITDITPASYAEAFDTNVLGTLLGVKHAMRAMAAQGGGSIVNISSTMGERGAPNSVLYVASKHAVEGITKAAALDGAAVGVRVNAIAPGPVQTAMLHRLTAPTTTKPPSYAASRSGGQANPMRSPTPSSSCRQSRHPSSPAKSSASTEADSRIAPKAGSSNQPGGPHHGAVVTTAESVAA